MSDIEFKLGTFSNNGGGPFVGLVIGEKIYTLSTVVEAAEAQGGGKGPTTTAGIYEMLADWDANFDALCAVADFVANDGRGDADWDCVATLSDLRVLPPILNPSKMIYAAANYGGHIREMLNAGTARTEEERENMLDRDKARVRPYSFLKAPSSLAGAFDDIVIPPETQKVDWEVELALVIGRTAKRVPAERALDYVAGYMTTNDVTARDAQSRPDWPTLRTDWFTGKSHDTFAPMGPYLVPAAFVPDYRAVQLTRKSMAKPSRTIRRARWCFPPKSRSNTLRRSSRSTPAILYRPGRPKASATARAPISTSAISSRRKPRDWARNAARWLPRMPD